MSCGSTPRSPGELFFAFNRLALQGFGGVLALGDDYGNPRVALGMALVSCALPSSGLMRYLPGQLVGVFDSAVQSAEYRKVLATYLASTGDEIVTVPYGPDGRTDLAALQRAVAERWRKVTGTRIAEGYGLTEATCASARSFPAESRRGHVGQRFPDLE